MLECNGYADALVLGTQKYALFCMQEQTDLMSFMLRNRIIFVGQRIDDAVRSVTDRQMFGLSDATLRGLWLCVL